MGLRNTLRVASAPKKCNRQTRLSPKKKLIGMAVQILERFDGERAWKGGRIPVFF